MLLYNIEMPRHHKKKTILQDAKKKTGAKAQSRQIQRLARSVDIVKEKTKELSIPTNYHTGYSSRTDAYPLVVPLTGGPKSGAYAGGPITNNTPLDDMNWVKWGSFPGAAVNTQKGRIRLYSQYVDMILEPGGETDLLIHTIFVVQLRDENEGMARQTYERTAKMTALEEDLDYCTNPDRQGGQVWLNPQLFRIHKRYEFHTGGDTNEYLPSGQNMRNYSAGINRVCFKLNYGGRQLRATERSAEIQSITYNDIPPEYKYFIVAFSDNSVADLENPLLSVSSTIHTRIS